MNPLRHRHDLAAFPAAFRPTRRRRAAPFLAALALLALCAGNALWAGNAYAGPSLVIEMPSGAVLYENRATEPWYPASLTKLMTVYVALNAVRDHKITLETPIAVSKRAALMAPSKMGFSPGTLVTLDNALKMLMVKSANDIAVAIAEGVSGSVEAFAEDMNEAARALGMTQSHFVNPNGLPDPAHVSSARDFAILARALYLTFPEHAGLFNIGALQLGGQIIRNHNDLLGRYPGTDGMKTGFICASGFNIVASATQGGRQIIAVILGAPNVRSRAMMAATLFDRAFSGIDRPSKMLADLVPERIGILPGASQNFCLNRGKLAQVYNAETERLMAPLLARAPAPAGNMVLTTTEAFARPAPIAARIAMVPAAEFDPVPVYAGPPAGYGGLVAKARPPHSPIGTPLPPGSVSAYASAEPESGAGDAPLSLDAAALPLKGGAKAKANPVRQLTHKPHAAKVAPAKHGAARQRPAAASQGKLSAGAAKAAGKQAKR
ncbi:MAG TPA: serine hydrolase [Methylocella sp.]|nr:serine hydrolase [Methylocella sp.]